MGLLYGRAGRLNTKNGGFRPGQLFPLPALTRGTSAKPGEALPTCASSASNSSARWAGPTAALRLALASDGYHAHRHVYKRGREGGPTKLQDHFQIGTWTEGKPGEVAVWTPTPNIPFQARGGGVLVDPGLFYASKDFCVSHLSRQLARMHDFDS